MQSHERSAKWDNLKFVLIFLVVLGHMLFPFRNESAFVKGLYVFIYTFHMPLFIFVSGLFSKTIIGKKQWNRVLSYLILYLFIRSLDTIGTLVHTGKLKINFLKTNGPDWYAMAVFLFLVFTILFKNVRPVFLIILSVFIGLLAGYTDVPGNLFAFMRTCVFYPFFLMGYYADREKIELFDKPVVSVVAGLLLAVILIMFIVKGVNGYDFIQLLKGKKAYDEMGLYGFEGLFMRGIQYLCACVIGILVVLSVPSDRNVFSVFGSKTLPIFVWHYLILKIFWAISGKQIVMKLFPDTYVAFLLCMCLMIIIFCSSHIFDNTNRIMKFN